MRVLGVAPGVSLPLGRPGVSSQRLFEGVCAGVCPGVYKGPETKIKNTSETICNFKILVLDYWILPNYVILSTYEELTIIFSHIVRYSCSL